VPIEKYNESITLGQAVVDRARSDRSTLERMLKTERQTRVQAERERNVARGLLEAVVTKYRNERVESTVNKAIEEDPRLKAIEKRLRECETPRQVEDLIKGVIMPVSEGHRYPTDLPPVGGPIREGQRPKVPAQKGPTNLMEALKTQGKL